MALRDDTLVGGRPLAGAADVERIVGQVGQRAHQVVAQGRASLRLPSVVAGQHAHRIPQPAEVERVEHLPVRGRGLVDGQVLPTGEIDDVERGVHQRPQRPNAGPRCSGTPAASRAASLANTWSRILPRRCVSSESRQLADPGLELGHDRSDLEGRSTMTQQPQRAALDHATRVEEQLELRVELDVRRQGFDLFPHRREVEDVARRDPRAHHVDDTRAGVLGHAVVERDARQVDHLVGDLRGDDLATQPMAEDLRRDTASAAASGSSERDRARGTGRRGTRCAPSRSC